MLWVFSFFLKLPHLTTKELICAYLLFINFVQEMDYHYRDASFMFIFMYS